MAMFKIGDHVERMGSLIPQYMREGVVLRIFPNKNGVPWLTEYEVNFGKQMTATFYESQLRLVKNPSTELQQFPGTNSDLN
jgi:hypothetical protein